MADGARQGSCVPPLLICCVLTCFLQSGLVNHVHYIMQFMWVMANLVWAYGELFLSPIYDEPLPLFPVTSEALHSMRWFSSWILAASFVMCLALHVAWIAKGTDFPPTYSSLHSAR